MNTDFYDDLNADGKMDSWSYKGSLNELRVGFATSVYKITPTYVTGQN